MRDQVGMTWAEWQIAVQPASLTTFVNTYNNLIKKHHRHIDDFILSSLDVREAMAVMPSQPHAAPTPSIQMT